MTKCFTVPFIFKLTSLASLFFSDSLTVGIEHFVQSSLFDLLISFLFLFFIIFNINLFILIGG